MNDIYNIYKEKFDKHIETMISDRKCKCFSLSIDYCFDDLILTQKNNLKSKKTVIEFQQLFSHQLPTLKNREPNFLISIIKKFILWILTTFFLGGILGVDMLIDLSFTIIKEGITRSQAKLIKGELKPSHKKEKKYKNIKKILIVNDYSSLTEEQIQYLKYIIFLIKEKYIANTLLIVLTKTYEIREIGCENISFYLEIEDLKRVYSKCHIEQEEFNLFKTLSIKYFDDLVESLSNKNNNDLKTRIVENIISNRIINISNEEMFKFLKLCAYLFPIFSQKDIEDNFSNIIDNIMQCLDEVRENDILKKYINNQYEFSEVFIRRFFETKSQNILSSNEKKELLFYLNANYPNQTYNLAVATINLGDDDFEKISCLLISYYANANTVDNQLSIDEVNYIRTNLEFLVDDNFYVVLSDMMIKNPNDKYQIESILRSKTYSNINYIAKLSTLGLILPCVYEYFYNDKSILDEYISIFTKYDILNREDSNNYIKYMIDCIVLSTANDSYKSNKIDMLLVKVLSDKDKMSYKDKEKLYRLSNLLLENPEKELEIGYEITKDKPYLHELYRVNYSVALLFSGKYQQAYNLLKDKKKLNLKEIDFDVFMSTENNLIVSSLVSNNLKKKTNPFNKLLTDARRNVSKSDSLIILNNKIALDMLNGKFNYSLNENLIKEVESSNDNYHIFYLYYNLLTFSYLEKEFNIFKKYIKILKVPSLLDNYKSYFNNKLEVLCSSIEKHQYFNYEELKNEYRNISYLYEDLRIGINNEVFLFGIIERWYE